MECRTGGYQPVGRYCPWAVVPIGEPLLLEFGCFLDNIYRLHFCLSYFYYFDRYTLSLGDDVSKQIGLRRNLGRSDRATATTVRQ